MIIKRKYLAKAEAQLCSLPFHLLVQFAILNSQLFSYRGGVNRVLVFKEDLAAEPRPDVSLIVEAASIVCYP